MRIRLRIERLDVSMLFRIAETRVAGNQLNRFCVVKTAKWLISRQCASLIVRNLFNSKK